MEHHANVSDWDCFIKTGRITGTVRNVIAASWQRCAAAGLNPDRPGCEQLDADGFEARLKSHWHVVHASAPYLDFLASSLRHEPYIAALLDEEGWCLEIRGEPHMLNEAASLGLLPGSRWDETNVGTMGAATALVTRDVVIVNGNEHFLRSLHGYTSMASPIAGPGNRPLGALTLLFPCEEAEPARITALISAARMLEREFRLRFQEKEMRAIRDSMVRAGLFSVMVVDSEGRVIDASGGAEGPPAGLIGETVMPGMIRTADHPVIREALETGKKVYRRYRSTVQSEEREYEVLSVPLFAADPAPFGAVTLAVDRTEEARLAQQLEETAALLSSFSKMDEILLAVADPGGCLTYVSGLAARILGGDSETLIGRPIRDLWGQDALLAVEEALAGYKPVVADQWVEGKDGVRRLLHILALPVWAGGRNVGAVALGVDLTAIHDATERASRAESIIHSLFESKYALVCLTDGHGEILSVNDSALERFGVSRETIVGCKMEDILSSKPSLVMQVLETGMPFYGVKRFLNGIVLKALILPIRHASGEMLGTLTVGYDAQDEEIVHALKAGLFQNPVDGVMVVDINRRVRDINDCALSLLGLSHEKALGESLTDILPAGLGEKMNECLKADPRFSSLLEKTGEGEGARWIEICTTPVKIDGVDSGAVLFVHDATERVNLQEKAHRAEQMELMGGLATRAAHEFRNPLGAIKAAAELGINVVDHPRAKELFQKIEWYVENLDNFVEEILYLGRPKSQLRPERILPILAQAVEDVEHQAKTAGVYVELRAAGDDLKVMAESKALGRAVVNLLRNSIQAMQGGGYVEVSAVKNAQGRVEISIHDTGPGISEEVRRRLFRPFTTTKTDGNGLGLSIVHQIVTEMHKGEIEVLSEPGEGTVAIIRLLAGDP